MTPDLQSELNRKASGAIQALLQRNTVGLIDDDQLFVGVQAIWDSVSGLVDGDVSDLLSSLLSNRDGIGTEATHIFSGNNRLICLLCRRFVDGTGEVEIRMLGTGGAKVEKFDSTVGAAGAAKAIDRCKQLCEQFVREGYQKLL